MPFLLLNLVLYELHVLQKISVDENPLEIRGLRTETHEFQVDSGRNPIVYIEQLHPEVALELQDFNSLSNFPLFVFRSY